MTTIRCGGHCGLPTPTTPTPTRRASDLARWLIPGAILSLMPKCPLCIAGYIALATGIGISVSAVAYLRELLIILCLASLLYAAFRRRPRLAAHTI